ncbi:hypothetical protein [Chryseobacterium sp. G0240]|uniref:hypothetical protein n=1 Tax=Chryseobacterium sp. G0240 TaxID=2487066 RepID=UPI001620CEBC|nr:hypothetical protein [Chryseobacterium sp. G0240]
MIILFKAFIIILFLVFGLVLAIVVFTMADCEIHLVGMEYEMEAEILKREQYEQLKNSE